MKDKEKRKRNDLDQERRSKNLPTSDKGSLFSFDLALAFYSFCIAAIIS